MTALKDNVYDVLNLPTFSPKQIVAFDKSGKRVYTQCVQNGDCK